MVKMNNSQKGEKLTLKEKETADMLIEYVVEMDKKLKEALIKELRKKNPKDVFVINDAFDEGYSKGFDRGWIACVDCLKKLLKEKK